MKLTFYLDGQFTSEQHNELSRVFEDFELIWHLNFIPQIDDYFILGNFTDILPDFCKEGSWKVDCREFVNTKEVKLGLMYLD